MTSLYLKKELQTNVAMLVTLKKRGGSYPEKKFGTQELTGRMEFLYIFADANGQELKHYAKEREEETLSLFKPGETLQVVRQEKVGDDGKRFAFLVWTGPDGVEAVAAANPLPKSNSAIEGQKRKLDEQREEEDRKWRKIDLSKIVFGYMNTALAQGKTPAEAAELAATCYELQEKTVTELFDKHFPA